MFHKSFLLVTLAHITPLSPGCHLLHYRSVLALLRRFQTLCSCCSPAPVLLTCPWDPWNHSFARASCPPCLSSPPSKQMPSTLKTQPQRQYSPASISKDPCNFEGSPNWLPKMYEREMILSPTQWVGICFVDQHSSSSNKSKMHNLTHPNLNFTSAKSN